MKNQKELNEKIKQIADEAWRASGIFEKPEITYKALNKICKLIKGDILDLSDDTEYEGTFVPANFVMNDLREDINYSDNLDTVLESSERLVKLIKESKKLKIKPDQLFVNIDDGTLITSDQLRDVVNKYIKNITEND